MVPTLLGAQLVVFNPITTGTVVPTPTFYHSFNNDSGTGTTVTADIGDNCSAGTSFPDWVEDPAMSGNWALDFDASVDRIDCGTSLDGMNDFSVSFWINADSYGEGSLGVVVTKASSSADLSWICHLNNLTSNGFMVCRISNTSNTFDTFRTDVDSMDAVVGGGWTHIAFTVGNCASMACGTGGAPNTAQFYVDGSPVTTTQSADNTGTRKADDAHTVRIGDSGSSVAVFEGDIDEVKVWATTILSAAEVAALFAEGR